MPCNIYRIGAKFCDLAWEQNLLDECLHSSMKWSSGTFSPQEDKRFSFGHKQYLNNLAYFVPKLYKGQTAPCHLKTFWKHITESIQCRIFFHVRFSMFDFTSMHLCQKPNFEMDKRGCFGLL